MQKILNKKSLFVFVFSSILLISFSLRTYVWLHSAGLWADEGCVLQNILTRNFLHLFLPLDNIQCTPPLFLILQKFVVQAFPFNKTAMRFLPYLASILSVIAFAFLTLKLFKNKMSILFSNFVFATHSDLLFFTQAYKQYSTDVLFSILIFIIGLALKTKKLSPAKWFGVGVFAIISILSSYISILLIAILICFYLLKMFKDKAFDKNFLAFIIPVGAFFIPYFLINCLPAIKNEGLQLYWHTQEAFFPVGVSAWGEMMNFLVGTKSCLILCSILLIFGLVHFYNENKFAFEYFISVFVSSIVFALLSIYPLSPSRVSAFLIPYVIILISAFWTRFGTRKIISALVIVFYMFCISYCETFDEVKYLTSQKVVFKQSNADLFIKYLYDTEVKPTDYIFVDFGSQVIFQQYDYEKRFKESQILYNGYDFDFEKTMKLRKIGDEIFFFISDDYIADDEYKTYKNQIDTKCKILLEKTSDDGTFLKCRVVR